MRYKLALTLILPKTLTVAPGDYHVMLEMPKERIKVGRSIPMTFTFSQGEQVTAQCDVKGATAMGD